jgi:hypothetical protein
MAAVISLALGAAELADARNTRHCPADVSRIRIHGRVAWCASSPREKIISDVVASERAGAIAFATRTRGLAMQLVVVLLGGENDLLTMTWDLPPAADERTPTVTWLGRRRVAFGYSLAPELIASWTVRER